MLSLQVSFPGGEAWTFLWAFWTYPQFCKAMLIEFVLGPRRSILKLRQLVLAISKCAYVRFKICKNMQSGRSLDSSVSWERWS